MHHMSDQKEVQCLVQLVPATSPIDWIPCVAEHFLLLPQLDSLLPSFPFLTFSFAVDIEFWFCNGSGRRPTVKPEYGCVGFDTNPQVAGAAAEPPLPLTVGCVRPTVVTVTIVTHGNEVLDSLAMLVVEL